MTAHTRIPDPFWQTGFEVDDTRIHFGILRSSERQSIGDWQREPMIARLEGISGVVTQVIAPGGIPAIKPRTISYRLELLSVADAQVLDGLLGQVGTLILLNGAHTVPVTLVEQEWMLGRLYDRIPDVLLLSLANGEVFVDEVVEVDATFQLDVAPGSPPESP